MFVAVYWWRVHPGKEDQFRDAWRRGTEHITRSTMVFRKEDGDWRVVHVHFSEAATTPRPGGV